MTYTNALPGGGLGQDPEEAAPGDPATPCPSCLGAGGMVSLGGRNSRDHTRQGPGIVSTMLWGAPWRPPYLLLAGAWTLGVRYIEECQLA